MADQPTYDFLAVSAVSAASSYSGRPASNITDGDRTTRWTPNDPGSGGSLPQWMQFDLASAQVCAGAFVATGTSTSTRKIDAITVQGSNGGAWTDIESLSSLAAGWVDSKHRRLTWTNTTAYSSYRIVVTATTGEVYIDVYDVVLLGAETAAATPPASAGSAVTVSSASASTTYSGYPASNLIDGNTGTQWFPTDATAGHPLQWAQFTLGTAKTCTGVTITAANNGGTFSARQIAEMVVQGSNDAAAWKSLRRVDGLGGTWTAGDPRTFYFANATAYLYYRLLIVENNGEVYTGIAEVSWLEAVAPSGETGSGAVTSGTGTVSGTGVVTRTGSGAVTTGAGTVAGTGTTTITGAGAVTSGAGTVDGTGAVSADTTGSGNVTTGPGTITGAGVVTYTGSGALTTGPGTITGTGDVAGATVTGTGSITTGPGTVDGLADSGVGAWDADVTGRAYVGVTTTPTDLYTPPPVADPPAAVTPVAITAYRQVVTPPTAGQPVQVITHPDEETVGVPHVWVDGIDRTYSLDGELCDLDDLVSEAGYGDRTAKLTVRGMEIWNAPTGDPAFPWLRRGARVEAGVVHPTTGARKVWWSGDLVSTTGSSRGASFVRSYDCTGPALALARAKHQPPPYMDPTDVGVVWARIMNGVASAPYAKVKPVRTGIMTRKRGSIGQSEAEYLREILATAWVGDRPWRPVKSATNPRRYELRLIDTTTVHWTCTAGAHGVDVEVTEDWTSVPNRIFGRGTLPGGHRWFNTYYPWFLPYDPPDYPFTDPDAEILVGMSDADTDSGDGVSVMEARLNELGYRVTENGVYEGAEVDVIRAFQRARGLLVDGRIGGQTWTGLWAVGYQGANLRSVRLPLASDPRVEEFLYLPNGAVAGPNPEYDEHWPVVEEDFDFGERTTRTLGVKDAQQRIDRFALSTPLVGSITMTATDFQEGSRYLADENDNLLLLGWEGEDVLFHIVDRKINRAAGSVTFTVDSAFRDALTVREILRRNSEAAANPASIPGAIGRTQATSSPDMGTPFDGDSPAGKIPGYLTIRHDLWSVFPVPMSEYGNLARVEARTSNGPCRFAMLTFGMEILPAQIAAGPAGDPLHQDRPWSDEETEAWLTAHGFIDGWGHQGEAAGYGSGQQAKGDPVNGRFLGTSAVPFYLPKSIMWVAVIAEENCRFYFDASPQAGE